MYLILKSDNYSLQSVKLLTSHSSKALGNIKIYSKRYRNILYLRIWRVFGIYVQEILIENLYVWTWG